jgi:putative FmdB family regulatory protein
MPIYEFYCPACHTILNFLARSPKPDARPACPRCGRRGLERQMSRFAAIGRAKAPADPAAGPDTPAADARMERAMAELANRAETMDENDPRAAARLMREMSGLAGMKLGPGMQEALKRLEAGEDPEAIEADMGDLLNEDDGLSPEGEAGTAASPAARRRPPHRDPTLYDL